MKTGRSVEGLTSKPFLLLREQWQLLLELCHFTEDLNPLWQTRTFLNRLKNLSQPIIQKVKLIENEDEKFKTLIHFFFDQLEFEIAKTDELHLQNSFLPYVLTSRRGPAPVLMLLFCCLLAECGIKAQVSSGRLKYLLKIQLNNRPHIVDFGKKCDFLKPYEIVELINRGFDFSNGTLNSNTLVIEYLNLLTKLSRRENKLQILSMTHSYLMKYQPFNLKHLSERALIAYETGDYRTAVDDIRSYFQYKQADFTNDQLKKIYKMALKLDRHSKNIHGPKRNPMKFL